MELTIKDFIDYSVNFTNEEINNLLNEIACEFEKQGKFEEAIRCKKSFN